MNEKERGGGPPTWFMGGILLLLVILVGLTWLNGAMLNRQHHELAALREEVQYLSESVEANGSEEEEGFTGASRLQKSPRFQRVGDPPEDQEPALKDLKESRDSARKAVREARETRSKLSLEENARKAEEKQQIEAAQRWWQPWAYGVIALVAVALGLRAWFRRRG